MTSSFTSSVKLCGKFVDVDSSVTTKLFLFFHRFHVHSGGEFNYLNIPAPSCFSQTLWIQKVDIELFVNGTEIQ